MELDQIGKVSIREFSKLCNITNMTFAQIALSPFDSGKTGGEESHIFLQDILVKQPNLFYHHIILDRKQYVILKSFC
jgi:hypothetical protein